MQTDEDRGDLLFQVLLDRQEERRNKIEIGKKFKVKDIKNHPVSASWIEIYGFYYEDNTIMVQISTDNGWSKHITEYELGEYYEEC